jgi:hypothetical protein
MAIFLTALVATVFLILCWLGLGLLAKLGEFISETFGDFALLVFAAITLFLIMWLLVWIETL